MSRSVCTQGRNTLAGWPDAAQENGGGICSPLRLAGPSETSKGHACFQSSQEMSARLSEQESVEEGDGKRDSFWRRCGETLDETPLPKEARPWVLARSVSAEKGEEMNEQGVCPIFCNLWFASHPSSAEKRAAAVILYHYGSGHGVQSEHLPDLKLAKNSLALLGPA